MRPRLPRRFARHGAASGAMVAVLAAGLFAGLDVPAVPPVPAPAAAPAVSSGTMTRASINSLGVEGNQSSFEASISGDGRFVAFSGEATNLVPDDTNFVSDVFVHDRLTGTTERVSLSTDGEQGDDASSTPSLSDSGRWVAFVSAANNLVPDDTNTWTDVFVHDRLTGATVRASGAQGGASADADCNEPEISADGRFVAFQSFASNLVPADDNGTRDVFVHDLQDGTTARVSIGANGNEGNNFSGYPALSGDGRIVAFHSEASNLVPGDVNATHDIFVRDTIADTLVLASVPIVGAWALSSSLEPDLSRDGRYVAFGSHAGNLVPGDFNGEQDIFVRDLLLGVTTRVSITKGGPQANNGSGHCAISGDGRFVVFMSSATNLVLGDENPQFDSYVHDRLTGRLTSASFGLHGLIGNDAAYSPAISGDGRTVAFYSHATNLVLHDDNASSDVFVRSAD